MYIIYCSFLPFKAKLSKMPLKIVPRVRKSVKNKSKIIQFEVIVQTGMIQVITINRKWPDICMYDQRVEETT